MTSSPAPIPNATNAKCNPDVAEFTANAYGARTYSPNSRSNLAVLGPVVSQPELSVSITSAISSLPMAGRLNGINESICVLTMLKACADWTVHGGQQAPPRHLRICLNEFE